MKSIKLGHQAPKGWRINNCQYIEVEGRFNYNPQYNFVYDQKEELYKLYQGQACYYTDARFDAISYTGGISNITVLKLHPKTRRYISHKSAIRKLLKLKGLPIGTLVELRKNWYYIKHPKLDNTFIFKVKKENPIDITYEINHASLFRDFSTSGKEQELVIALRNNGFLVSVTKDNLHDPNGEYEEVATAYGYGKKVGFSALGLPVHGYYNGTDKVLWDIYGEFDKWSKCNHISMFLPTEEILDILLRNDEKDINWCN